MMMRVSDYISSFLVEKGVDTTYMLAGGGMMHLIDAVGRQKGLRYVSVHHEQAAAMAADAYARLKGFGACYVTSGPGGTNALTGLVEAWLDSTPMIVLSGQSKVSQTIRRHHLDGLRQFGTFEVDIVPMVQSVTKYAVMLEDPKRVRYEMEKLYAIATAPRQGPVWMDVPVDVSGAKIDPDTLEGYTPLAPAVAKASPDTWTALLAKIRAAKRPLLVAGHGVKVAHRVEQFRALVDALGIPVATTPFAVDLVPYASPLLVGHPSAKGDRAGNFAIQNADLIVSVGQSFHVLTTGYEMEAFAPKSQRVMVEIDPMVVKRQEIRIDQHVAASVEDFIDGMTKAVASAPKAQGGDWVEYCRYLKAELDVMKEPHKHTGSSINYYDIIDALNRLSGDDDVVVTDAGLAFYLVGQAFKPKPGQHVINSGGLGSMGFAMGAAVGAATANPKRRVICLTGDGSLQCNVQELATYAANRLNIALVIVNNGGYVSIRNTQNNYFGGLLVGSSDTSGVVMPDLAKLCAAYGLPYTSVKALDGLNGVLGEALKAPGPVVCEVFIPHENEVIPSVMSKKRDDGTMESKPLHDMYPFFPDQKVKDLMFEGWLAKKAR